MLLLAIMTVCLILIVQTYCQSVWHRAQQEELRKMVKEINVGTGDNGHNMKDGSMFGDTLLTLSTYDPVIYF